MTSPAESCPGACNNIQKKKKKELINYSLDCIAINKLFCVNIGPIKLLDLLWVDKAVLQEANSEVE